MRCRDLEELLSAYADGELNRTQKDFIEEHLRHCESCRATLGELEAARSLLLSLQDIPAEPDIREITLSRIKTGKDSYRKVSWRWLRPVVTAAVLMAVIAVVLATQPWKFSTPAASAAGIE